MARPKKKGGYQAPRSGGGASAPGALSQRKVPHLEHTGHGYGKNQQLNEQQAAAPLSPAGTPGGGVTPSPRRALPTGEEGIFGGTDRPAEPMTAGIDWGAGPGSPPQPMIGEADDVELAIRQAFAITQSPHLLRLLDRIVR